MKTSENDQNNSKPPNKVTADRCDKFMDLDIDKNQPRLDNNPQNHSSPQPKPPEPQAVTKSGRVVKPPKRYIEES